MVHFSYSAAKFSPLRLQMGDLAPNDVPDQLYIHSKIIVNHHVPKACYFAPSDLRMGFPKRHR